MKTNKTPSQEYLKELFTYDGKNLRWKIKKATNTKIGSIAGWIDKEGYLLIRIDGTLYRGHRLIYKMFYNKEPDIIDHIDCNKSNNSINNLRSGTQSYNNCNIEKARSHNITGVLGVSFHKPAQKYQARIGINGKLKHLGLFLTAEEASKAYQKAKLKRNKELSWELNQTVIT